MPPRTRLELPPLVIEGLDGLLSDSGHHLMLSRVGRLVVPADLAFRREAVVRIQRVHLGQAVVVAIIVGNHLHLAAFLNDTGAAILAQAVESSLTQIGGLSPGFARYHLKVIQDQGHLETLIIYILDQPRRHGDLLDLDHLGSMGPELVGGRLLPTRGGLIVPPCRKLLRERMPKLREQRIVKVLLRGGEFIELAKLGSAPAGLAGAELASVLLLAAASAIGRVTLEPRRMGVASARAALVQLLDEAPFGRSLSLREDLGFSRHEIAAARRRAVEPEIVSAVTWQVRFLLSRRIFDLRQEPTGRNGRGR